ncbi:MAG: O-antigen ligase family protein [Candidatus Obscuribacterales bacterium]|nr:O-antigen ligase family protein [Candidatus Obscuribacterales bacterium]
MPLFGGSTNSLSQTPTKWKNLYDKLSLWQGYLFVFFAVWLPISISAVWIGIVVGAIFWAATSFLALKIVLDEMPKDGSVNTFQYVRSKLPAIVGCDDAPLLVPLAIFTLVIMFGAFCVPLLDGKTAADGLRVATRTLVSLKALIVYPWACQVLRRSDGARAPAICVLLLVSSLSCLYAPIEPSMKEFLRNITDNPPHDQNLLILHHMTDGFIRWVTGSRTDYLQGTGFLEQPMAFAGQMQTVMMMALALLLCRGYRWLPGLFGKRSIAIAIACCVTIGIIFGAERSAWLGVIAGVIVVCASVSRKMVVASLAGLFLLGCLSYFCVPIVKDRVDILFKPQQKAAAVFHESNSGPFKDPSVIARFHIWEAAIDKFKQKPIFGSSLIRFGVIHAKSAMPDKGYFDHAHSNYLHMLAATGLVGFAAYLYLLYSIFSTTVKLSKPAHTEGLAEPELQRLRFERSVAVGLLAASASLAVSGLFEFNFGTGHVRLTYFYWLAFLSLSNCRYLQSMRNQEKLGAPTM